MAGLEPDLIVASDYQVDEQTYAKLKKLAPTLVLDLNTDDASQTPFAHDRQAADVRLFHDMQRLHDRGVGVDGSRSVAR